MLQINIISSLILFVLIFTLIVLGLIETKIHFLSLKKIPNRIHVNGIRGKSSVVRFGGRFGIEPSSEASMTPSPLVSPKSLPLKSS